MSLSEGLVKIKGNMGRLGKGDIYIVLLIILVGFSGFGLGRLSKVDSEGGLVNIENVLERYGSGSVEVGKAKVESAEPVPTIDTGLLVGSKNSDKYHFPWCSGAARIKDENRVWFDSIEEARTAGYEPAKNCKGLE